MEANKSVERPEMEVRVETALELAGAEEGACELEKSPANTSGQEVNHDETHYHFTLRLCLALPCGGLARLAEWRRLNTIGCLAQFDLDSQSR